MTLTNGDVAHDTGAAWDDLYDTHAGREPLPEPPETPRHRRFRKRLLLSFLMTLMLLGGIGAGGYLATQSVSRLLVALSNGNAAYLESHVDWPGLQGMLRDDLIRILRPGPAAGIVVAPAAAATQAYLGRFVDGMVATSRQPASLARVLQGRVFPREAFGRGGVAHSLGAEIDSFDLIGDGALRVNFRDSADTFPSGASLCVRLLGDGQLLLQLFGIGWPETARHC